MSKAVFKWIHLSDIHFQPITDSFNDARIRSTLPDFLKEKCEQCDSIIISGDFRYAPQKEETNANQVIDYIRQIAELIKVDDDNIILVPGNHDLERSKPRDNQINGTRNDYKTNEGLIDKDVLTLLANDFVFYSNVQEPFKNSLKISGETPHRIVELENCSLLLMNTALVAGKDDEANKLILGSKYISDLLENTVGSKPMIAVGHHGLSLLEPQENKEITRYFDDKAVRLYLCGHEHSNGLSSFGNKGKQVNVGCLKQGTEDAIAGFSTGALYDNGDVEIVMYKWDRDGKVWCEDKRNTETINQLYPDFSAAYAAKSKSGKKVDPVVHSFYLKGFQLLGDRGCDGIKYVWGNASKQFVESIAFNRRTKFPASDADNNTSAYTISSSIGCQLSTFDMQCIFCQTGANKYFPLTADDLALQCIFMAEYDSNCLSYPEVRDHAREFAFMGQGEPGFCYDTVKRAILLNDYVMKKIGQKVSKYIISTCGITDFMSSLIDDCSKDVYSNKVTLHFSLNTIGKDRDTIMPINKMYCYNDFLEKCKLFYKQTQEKIVVSILLMVDYKTNKSQYISLDTNKLQSILALLDPTIFNLDFCTVNKTLLGSQRQLSNEDSNRYLKIAKDMGFECKLFSSIGDSSLVGCGVLSSSVDDLNEPGNTTIKHYNRAVELLKEAKEAIQ